MHMLKLLSFLFLALYLLIVGLHGVGMDLGFIPAVVTNFFALAAGVLFLVRAVKAGCCCHDSCHKP